MPATRLLTAKKLKNCAFWAVFSLFAAPLAAQPGVTGGDLGAKRFQACTTCHGAGATASVARTANEAYFPRIAGKPARYLLHQLQHYRDGRRGYPLMADLVGPLSDAYLWEMSQHFAALDLPHPAPQAPTPATTQATLDRGRALSVQGDAAQKLPSCASCHGANLMGNGLEVPPLLGLPRDYVAAQLGAWKTGLRRAHAPDCMADLAKRLPAQDINALAQWLAAQPVPRFDKRAAATGLSSNTCGSTAAARKPVPQ
jgi:cytochrome c553